jgi:hypothetical protein
MKSVFHSIAVVDKGRIKEPERPNAQSIKMTHRRGISGRHSPGIAESRHCAIVKLIGHSPGEETMDLTVGEK